MQALVMIPDGAGSSDRFDEVLRCQAAAVEEVSPSRADCPPGQALLCLGVGVRECFDRRPVGDEGPRRRPRAQSADLLVETTALVPDLRVVRTSLALYARTSRL